MCVLCAVCVCLCSLCYYQTHGHSEDILSVAVDVSNLMATSSYNGEVTVIYNSLTAVYDTGKTSDWKDASSYHSYLA